MKLWELEEALQNVKPFGKPKIQLEQYTTPAHIAANLLFLMNNSFNDIKGKTILDLGTGTGMLGLGCLFFDPKNVTGVDIDTDALEIAQENAKELEFEDMVDFINMDIFDFEKNVKEFLKSSSQNQLTQNFEKSNEETHTNEETVNPNQDEKNNDENEINENADDVENEHDDEEDEEEEDEEEDEEEEVEENGDNSKNILKNEEKFCKRDIVILNPPFGTRSKGIDLNFLRIGCLCAKEAVYSMHKSSTREYLVKKIEEWGVGKCEVVAQLRFELPRTYVYHKKEKQTVDVDILRIQIL